MGWGMSRSGGNSIPRQPDIDIVPPQDLMIIYILVWLYCVKLELGSIGRVVFRAPLLLRIAVRSGAKTVRCLT